MSEDEFNLVKKDTFRSKAFASITRQQEKYIFARLQGLSIGNARESAGYARKGSALEQTNQAIYNAINVFREGERERIGITRDLITDMIMEDRAASVNSTESLACAVQLGKLHGLYESDTQKVSKTEINITQNKLEILSDADLLKQASIGIESLAPVELIGETKKLDEPRIVSEQ